MSEKVNALRNGATYPFEFSELKISKGFVSLLTIVVDDNVDQIDSDINLSFIPNPRGYNAKIETMESQLNANQLSMDSRESINDKIFKIKSEYANVAAKYPPIDCIARTMNYKNGDKTKITFAIPYATMRELLVHPDFLRDQAAVVFVHEEDE